MTRAELEEQNLGLRAALREIYDQIAEILDLETCEDQEVLEENGDD